jgi:uncharacterized protein
MTRNALIVRGGWDGHQPIEATELFIPFLEEHGFDVRIEESNEIYTDREVMDGADLILQLVTMSTITPEALAGLRRAVEEGGTGFAGWHGGIADSYRNSEWYLQMVGGQFAVHPSKAPDQLHGAQDDNYLPYTVHMTDLGRTHEITAGIGDFDLVTEQYWVLHDDLNDVLATTTHPVQPYHPWHRPITSPAIWTRLWGEGRIFVSTPGHRVEILEDPNVKTIIERGLLWAARKEEA